MLNFTHKSKNASASPPPPYPTFHLRTRYHTGDLVAREFGVKSREIGVKSRDRMEMGKWEMNQKKRREDKNIDSITVVSVSFFISCCYKLVSSKN